MQRVRRKCTEKARAAPVLGRAESGPPRGARLTSYKEPRQIRRTVGRLSVACGWFRSPLTKTSKRTVVSVQSASGREERRGFSSEIRMCRTKQCLVGRLDDLCAPNCHDGVPLADATDADCLLAYHSQRQKQDDQHLVQVVLAEEARSGCDEHRFVRASGTAGSAGPRWAPLP